MKCRTIYDAGPAFWACVGVVAVVLGCSDGSGTQPVRGKVIFANGDPVTAGSVEFESQDHDPQINARGNIQEDGTFVLGTYKLDDGAVPGNHRVSIRSPIRTEQDPEPVGPTIHPRFGSYDQSGLKFTVEKGSQKEAKFTVEPR